MTFKKDFPSLKGKVSTVRQIVNQEITNIVGGTGGGYKDRHKFFKSKDFQKVEFILVHSVQKHCLDKAYTYRISEEEMHELICKGIVTTKKGLKLNATYEFDWDKQLSRLKFIKQEHILLEDYKQKVKEVIETHSKIINSNKFSPFGLVAINSLLDKIKKELGLK